MRFLICGAMMFLAGCAELLTAPSRVSGDDTPLNTVQPFSLTAVGETAPRGWQPWILSRYLARTQYGIVEHDGERVLAAKANVSASGLLQPLDLPADDYAYLKWRWKVPHLIPGADNASRVGDDSPVRVIVAFDGDKSKLDFEDAAFGRTVKLFSGREMPYASIQYIWENKLPPETVLENSRTSRSKMLVVESGPRHLGRWLAFRRDLRADFQRLFGEPPGPIIFVGVMTDSNATATQATAYYGDIQLSRD